MFNKTPFIRMSHKQFLTQTCRKLEFSVPYGPGVPRGNHYLTVSYVLTTSTPNPSQLFQQNRVSYQLSLLESLAIWTCCFVAWHPATSPTASVNSERSRGGGRLWLLSWGFSLQV